MMRDTQEMDNTPVEEFGSVPSSPALPCPARLADSSEIRDFDQYANDGGLGLNIITEEGKNGNGTSKNGGENIPNAQKMPKRLRHFSTGQPWHDAKTSLYNSFSADDDHSVCGFVQLYVLSESQDKSSTEREWGEVSRWVKYEQDLEEGSSRLGRPHIAPLGHLFLSKLHKLIGKSCTELFDLEEQDIQSIAAKIVEALLSKGLVDKEEGETLMKDLLLSHRPVAERKKTWMGSAVGRASFQRGQSLIDNVPDGERRHSLQRRVVHEDSTSPVAGSLPKYGSPEHVQVEVCGTPTFQARSRRGTFSGLARYFSTEDTTEVDGEQPFLPFSMQAEASMIMVRGGYKRRNGTIVLVRLTNSILLDVGQHFPIPTRFIAIILAPTGYEDDYIEIGKSLGTLLSNTRFFKSVQTAKDSKMLLSAINEFLDESIILPPGKWYTQNFYDLLPVHVLEVKCDLIYRQKKKDAQNVIHRCGTSTADGFGVGAADSGPQGIDKEQLPGPFERTGRAFGGLINDIKRRYPLYKSDIIDGLNSQTIAATIFLYFASIAHNVTFGGLLAQKTNGLIGVPETLVAASSSGIIYTLFSGQPLNVIAPTGPLLVFDELLYQFMQRHEIEFLPARVWIGMWVIVFAIIVTAFEGSIFVKHFSRFTMETFSALISVIFCWESLESLIHVYKEHPLVNKVTTASIHGNASLILNPNGNGTLSEHQDPFGEPNTALLSTFLMFGTFYLAYKLKHLRDSNLFPTKIRNTIGDFGVPIAIMLMVAIDFMAGDVYTTKIKVPSGLEPTTPSERGWLISPFGKDKFNPWMPLITFLPGGLVFLLMFMTVEICQKIMMSKGVLKKGSGMHLDPLVLAVINFGCGLFGFPWVSVATLKALAHIAALTVYSKNPPPGVTPTVLAVRENRMSALVMSLILGLSVFMAPVLKLIPMPVLFGVFLYMGITSFIPTQLYERLILFLVPVDQHPQTIYVRRVPTWKMHMYTSIQILSLAALWAVKSVKEIALFFPLILILLVPIRRSLQYIYTENELEALDGENPPVAARPKQEPAGEPVKEL